MTFSVYEVKELTCNNFKSMKCKKFLLLNSYGSKNINLNTRSEIVDVIDFIYFI